MENLNVVIIPESEGFTQGFQSNDNNNNTTPIAIAVDVAEADSVSEQRGVKRGRGRPRKNDGNGNMVLSTPLPSGGISAQPVGGSSTEKRGRGRPRGSGTLQILSAIGGIFEETAMGYVTTHVMTVNTGEDVLSKISSFFRRGHKTAICVLSATGTVSSVSIRPSGASGGVVRFEGRFQILTLSGSSTYSGGAGHAQRENDILTISLANPDGSVFGGGLQGTLIAASPVQLMLGSFKQNNRKHKRDIPDAVNVAGNANLMEGSSGFIQATTSNGEPDDVFAATTA